MSFTTLRVTEAGVVLGDAHAARLGTSDEVRRCFAAFCASARPGLYALWSEGGALRVESRERSRLVDGMAVRLWPSPLPPGGGPRPKPPPPSSYDAVRSAGVATLLTDASGTELYESCAAALVAWDGAQLVLVPEDRPRVASLAEALVQSALAPHRRLLSAQGDEALLLVNAVATCEPRCAHRRPFPEPLRARLHRLFEATATRTPNPGPGG